jgi:hypothetical protein
MSIRWDPLLAAATAKELDSTLSGSRARAMLLDGETRRFTLFLRDSTLVFELHPERGWFSRLESVEVPSHARRYPFQIEGVNAPEDESAITIATRPIRGRGEPQGIVLEMVRNRWNASIMGRTSASIRHVLVPRKDRDRSLLVGAKYEPPPRSHRLGIDGDLGKEQWQDLISPAGDEGEARRSLVMRRIAWTSSLNVDYLLGPEGWHRWKEMRDPENWAAFLISTSRGPQPYPVPLAIMGASDSDPQRPHRLPSLEEAFRIARERTPGVERLSVLLFPPDLFSELERRRRRSESKLRALQREYTELESPEDTRRTADLILARFSDIPRGVDRITLPDFAGEDIEVRLDPTLSPSENADRYYDEAARMERARENLPKLIRAAEQDLERWLETLERARGGTLGPDDARALLGPRASPPAARSTRGTGLPYRRFVSSAGIEIRVGRGARENDDLTFHHSGPGDVWLHARQASGAHVILRWQGEGRPPRQDLSEAANLAALHSSARHSKKVPVAWTRRKYVRKPRKSAPGSVIPDRTETVFVVPEPSLLRRLAAEE